MYKNFDIALCDYLLQFCRENNLPFESADDLIHREELTDYQRGFLMAYIEIWQLMEDHK
jgi:hypothetical protein